MRPLGRRLYEEAVAAYNFNGDREGPLSAVYWYDEKERTKQMRMLCAC